MKYTFFLLLILSFAACRENPVYDETTYPSEEDFLTNDTLAFYLEDLLWLPYGRSGSLGFFNTEPNVFNYHFRQEESGRYSFETFCNMRISMNGDLILDHNIYAELTDIDPAELPGTFVLDSIPGRYWTLRDQKQDKLYISTPAHPIVFDIPVFDTLQGRMEGFFEGRLVNQENPSDVVNITEGRFSISF